MSKQKRNLIVRLIALLERGQRFVFHDLWSTDLSQMPPKLKRLFKYLRVLILSLRGFSEDRVQTKASALTYYTVMSIVPVLAMIFAIAKGFGLEQFVERQVMSHFEGQEQIVNTLISFSHNMLNNTTGGLMAVVGIVMLLWSVAKILTNIEHALNDIWQVEKQRSLVRKFTDYLSIILVVPVLLIASSSLNIYITGQVNDLAQSGSLLSIASPFIKVLLKLLPLLLIWIVFSFVFIAMPNTKVSLPAGIIAGIIAGTLFLVVQWFYVYLQVGVSRYNAIYGSFAAIPLLLVWLQTSWLIMLFGAEVSFAYQNIDMYEYEHETEHMSHHNRQLLSILLLDHIVKRFKRGQPPQKSKELSTDLHIPQRLLRNLLSNMVECGLLSEVLTDENKSIAYQPAIDIRRLTLDYVEAKLDNHGLTIEPPVAHLAQVRTTYDQLVAQHRAAAQGTMIGEL
ncbi:MAG: YihY/virulence factor BrkB family protein [Bacteroidales bacterium]|nr:YihY/virulence factor BrkB family protein [Bacteroidales bacterium]